MNRGIPSLRMPCNCGSTAHCATAENSPCRLKQFVCPMLHFAKSHNVSGLFALVCPSATAEVNKETASRCFARKQRPAVLPPLPFIRSSEPAGVNPVRLFQQFAALHFAYFIRLIIHRVKAACLIKPVIVSYSKIGRTFRVSGKIFNRRPAEWHDYFQANPTTPEMHRMKYRHCSFVKM